MKIRGKFCCFAILLLLISLLAFVGCEDHTHSFGEWEISEAASCAEGGVRARSCSCGETEEEIIPAFGHTEIALAPTPATCTEDGLSEGKRCNACGEITVKQETISSLGHDYKYSSETDDGGNDVIVGICQRNGCGIIKNPMPGLYDSENNLLASWDELIEKYGLDIESYYNSGDFEKKTTHIAYILKNNEELRSAKRLVIDDSVTKIGAHAFEYCTSLEYLYLPLNLQSLPYMCFWECYSLKNIEVAEDNVNFKTIDGSLYGKNGECLIKYATGKEDKEFILPKSVKEIADYAFSFSSYLTTVYLHNNVTNIVGKAFYHTLSLDDVYYSGTEEEWEALDIHIANYPNDVVFHYDRIDRFMTYCFAGDFGSSGASGIVHFIIDGDEIYICDYTKKVLYTEITKVDNLQIEYMEYIYNVNDFGNNPERMGTIEKIQNLGEWYILKGVDGEGVEKTKIVCYLDGAVYLLDVYDMNEETYTAKVIRITYAIISLED